MGKDHYDVLGLVEGASMDEIKWAYRRLALRYHPDRNDLRQDGEKFKAISEAYRALRSGESGRASTQAGRSVNPDMKPQPWPWLGQFFGGCILYSKNTKTYRDILKYERIMSKQFGELTRVTSGYVPTTVRYGRAVNSNIRNACRPVLKGMGKIIRSGIGI